MQEFVREPARMLALASFACVLTAKTKSAALEDCIIFGGRGNCAGGSRAAAGCFVVAFCLGAKAGAGLPHSKGAVHVVLIGVEVGSKARV
jgi:hypothetical protein